MARLVKITLGLALIHLVLSAGVAVRSLRLAVEASNERALNPSGPSQGKVVAADVSGWLADVLWRPLAYCDAAQGNCAWMQRWLPGGWSLILLPANSLVWGLAAAGIYALWRGMRRRPT